MEGGQLIGWGSDSEAEGDAPETDYFSLCQRKRGPQRQVSPRVYERVKPLRLADLHMRGTLTDEPATVITHTESERD